MHHEDTTAVRRGGFSLRGLANIVGWSLGALVVATALSLAMEILFVDVLDAAIDPFTGGAVVPGWIQLTITSTVIGAAIGAVVGSRLHRGAMAAAVVVTLIFISVWPFAIPPFIEREVGMAIPVSVALYLAAAAGGAAFFHRRRHRPRRS